MSSPLDAVLPGAWAWNVDTRRWLGLLGLLAMAVAWPVFVFTGGQVAYLVSVVAACGVAVLLSVSKSSLTSGYMIALMALIGPEVNGQLGNGHAPLGSLRLIDAAAAAGVIAVFAVGWRSELAAIASRRRPGALGLLALLAVAYTGAMWLAYGHPLDGFLRADLRLIVLAALFWLLASRCRRGGSRAILWCIVGVGVAAALKAVAIHVSGIYAIGPFDRLQATSYYDAGKLRTILIGGDTLMILMPAVALLLASTTPRRIVRAALAVAGVLCLWALGLSATRTSALVSLGLVVAVLAAMVYLWRPQLSRRALVLGCVLGLVVLVVTALGGVASRLTHADAPHVGLNFRKDEINSFLNLSAAKKYLGQGLGGRFLGKNVNGAHVLAGWAHELPVWIALKAGVLGLLGACAALAVIARRAGLGLGDGTSRVEVLAGAALVLGTVVMSLTLDRLALPEGVLPFVVGVFLVGRPAPPAVVSAA